MWKDVEHICKKYPNNQDEAITEIRSKLGLTVGEAYMASDKFYKSRWTKNY